MVSCICFTPFINNYRAIQDEFESYPEQVKEQTLNTCKLSCYTCFGIACGASALMAASEGFFIYLCFKNPWGIEKATSLAIGGAIYTTGTTVMTCNKICNEKYKIDCIPNNCAKSCLITCVACSVFRSLRAFED